MTEQRFRRADRVAGRMLDGRYCLMKIADSELIVLNETGSCIWEELKQPRTLQAIVATLMNEFEVTEEVANLETTNFIQHLRDCGLVVVEPG